MKEREENKKRMAEIEKHAEGEEVERARKRKRATSKL